METNNLFFYNNKTLLTLSQLTHFCHHKTPVIVFLYSCKQDNCYLLYKMIKQNNNIDAVILAVENNIYEMLRMQRIIRNSFNNCVIIVIHSCSCNENYYGNFYVKSSNFYVCSNNKLLKFGDINMPLFCELKNKIYNQSYLKKINNLKVIKNAYTILIKTFGI